MKRAGRAIADAVTYGYAVYVALRWLADRRGWWGGIRPKAGGRGLDGRTWDEYPEQVGVIGR